MAFGLTPFLYHHFSPFFSFFLSFHPFQPSPPSPSRSGRTTGRELPFGKNVYSWQITVVISTAKSTGRQGVLRVFSNFVTRPHYKYGTWFYEKAGNNRKTFKRTIGFIVSNNSLLWPRLVESKERKIVLSKVKIASQE